MNAKIAEMTFVTTKTRQEMVATSPALRQLVSQGVPMAARAGLGAIRERPQKKNRCMFILIVFAIFSLDLH
jgi:hypothetical protein